MVTYEGYCCMLLMSRSTHDSPSYLYSEKRRWHSARGHWYPESCWEREPMQISRSKKVTLCCWLWEVIGKMLQWCTVQSGEKPRKGSRYFFFFFSCACGRGGEGHMCVLLSVFRLCLFQPRELQSRTNQKLPDSIKTYPMWTLRMWGQLVEESEGNGDRNGKQGGKKDAVAATNYSWF